MSCTQRQAFTFPIVNMQHCLIILSELYYVLVLVNKDS
jgi:hypothetical protein